MKSNTSTLSSKFIPGFMIIFGFIGLDILWILALPFLNISYGSFFQPLFTFFFFRISSFVLWSFLIFLIPKWRKTTKPGFLILLLFLPNLLLLGLGIYGFYIEPQRLTVNRIEIPVDGLEKKVRIVQLSDMHVERTTRREQALPALVESLHPDMIVITGDFLIESRFNVNEAVESLTVLIDQLNAPMGIYAVNGNVETPSRLKELMKNLNVKVLDNQIVRLSEISDNFV